MKEIRNLFLRFEIKALKIRCVKFSQLRFCAARKIGSIILVNYRSLNRIGLVSYIDMRSIYDSIREAARFPC